MATSVDSTPAPAMQPGFRSFIVYDRLPEGCATFPVTDDSNAPHLRAGEMVVIDTADHQPFDGELFAIQWQSGSRQIVETFHLPKLTGWCVGPLESAGVAGPLDGALQPQGRWCDFGYREAALSERILGRVVGILEPTFAEPARIH